MTNRAGSRATPPVPTAITICRVPRTYPIYWFLRIHFAKLVRDTIQDAGAFHWVDVSLQWSLSALLGWDSLILQEFAKVAYGMGELMHFGGEGS